MLSSLPTLADRNFIIGFFVPTLLATLAFILLFHDVAAVHEIYVKIGTGADWDELAVFVLTVWVAAIVMMALNHLIYRMAEGYLPPLSWFGNEGSTEARQALIAEREKLYAASGNPMYRDTQRYIDDNIDRLDDALTNRYPGEAYQTLPTRFGNTIRAFESYAYVVYGIDPISSWSRLGAVMSKGHASGITDVRAEVNFFLNTYAFAAIFTAIAIARFIICLFGGRLLVPFDFTQPHWLFIACAVVGLFVAWLAYEGAIYRAVAWGDLVKAAFDLYLPTLAKSLGYQLPKTAEERRAFWHTVGLMMLHFTPMDPTQYKSATPEKPENDEAG